MTGIADGGAGVWDQTGRDALYQDRDYVRTVTVLDADDLPNALDISWAVDLSGEIRTADDAATLLATAVVTLTTDGTDGGLTYAVAAGQLTAVTTQARHDIYGTDGSGNRYQLLVGRSHIRRSETREP